MVTNKWLSSLRLYYRLVVPEHASHTNCKGLWQKLTYIVHLHVSIMHDSLNKMTSRMDLFIVCMNVIAVDDKNIIDMEQSTVMPQYHVRWNQEQSTLSWGHLAITVCSNNTTSYHNTTYFLVVGLVVESDSADNHSELLLLGLHDAADASRTSVPQAGSQVPCAGGHHSVFPRHTTHSLHRPALRMGCLLSE